MKSDPLLKACEFIADLTGSCPADVKGWEHPRTCSKHCHENAEKDCWKTYFDQQKKGE